jgi:hypothetical protein
MKLTFDFNVSRSKKESLASYCRSCNRAASRQPYQTRQAYYIADATRRKRDAIEANSRRVWAYLSAHPRIDCGESDPVVLEFDHRSDKVRAQSARW